jgi:hypothetical protein
LVESSCCLQFSMPNWHRHRACGARRYPSVCVRGVWGCGKRSSAWVGRSSFRVNLSLPALIGLHKGKYWQEFYPVGKDRMQPANSPFWPNLFDLQIENQLIHTPSNLPKTILGQKKAILLSDCFFFLCTDFIVFSLTIISYNFIHIFSLSYLTSLCFSFPIHPF